MVIEKVNHCPLPPGPLRAWRARGTAPLSQSRSRPRSRWAEGRGRVSNEHQTGWWQGAEGNKYSSVAGRFIIFLYILHKGRRGKQSRATGADQKPPCKNLHTGSNLPAGASGSGPPLLPVHTSTATQGPSPILPVPSLAQDTAITREGIRAEAGKEQPQAGEAAQHCIGPKA